MNNEFTYEDLVEALGYGEELEFIYHGEQYSFIHNKEGWYIIKYSDWENDQEFKNTDELLANGLIEGKHIKDIWDEVE